MWKKNGVTLGCKRSELTIDCLVFSKDFEIFSDSPDTATKQTTAKADLEKSLRKRS